MNKKIALINIILIIFLIISGKSYAYEENITVIEENLETNQTIAKTINTKNNKSSYKKNQIKPNNPKRNQIEDLLFKSVFQPDYRTPVSDSNKYPFCCIGYLQSTFPNGKATRGTAFLIDDNIALTAGHCLYYPEYGGKATSLYFYPARNGNIRPYVSEVKSYVTLKSFQSSPNYANDWGIIILYKNLGDELGNIGANSYEDYGLENKSVRITGYPGEKPNSTPIQNTFDQWEMAGNVKLIEKEYIGYSIDTSKGQSGAPVYEMIENLAYAVGIHNSGQPIGTGIELNYGARITKEVIDICLEYMNQF